MMVAVRIATLIVVMCLACVGSLAQDPNALSIQERIPDAALLDAVDLELPGLEAVKAAVAAGDIQAAGRELAHYYRTRATKTWFFGASERPAEISKPAQLREWVRGFIARETPFAGEWQEDGTLDWWSDPNAGNKPRQYFFSSLAMAYFAAGEDPQVARLWIELMRDWVDECPPSSGHDYWNGMVNGIRLRGGWPDAFHAFLRTEEFSDQDVLVFLKSLLEQARFIRENHWPTGNQLTFAMVGLYTAGVAWPELKEADEWREVALQTAIDDLAAGYLPDGMGLELSPGYHQFYSNYLVMADLADEVGRADDPRIRQIVDMSERLYEVYVKLGAPDRMMPAYQRGGIPNVTTMLQAAARRYPDNPVFAWFATGGEAGHPPEYTSIAMPYAGYIAMRTGWEDDATYVGFDAGPIGWTHAHQDKLNVVLWAYGRMLLMDPSQHNYSREPLAMWAMDSFSHNVALVDGRPQRRRWRDPNPTQMPYQPLQDMRFVTTEAFDHAAGFYDGAWGMPGLSDAYPYYEDGNFDEGWVQPAHHHRRVLFLKPNVVVVADLLTTRDAQMHEYELRWQIDSTNVSRLADGLSLATRDEGLPNLAVIPLIREGLTVETGSGQMEPQILGYKLHGEPTPATTAMHRRSGGDVRLVTLLLPLRAGDDPPQVTSRWISEDTVVVELDEETLTITVPDDPEDDLRAVRLK